MEGGEFPSSLFEKYLSEYGITHQISCHHTLEQNIFSERKHRHIVESGLTLLAHAKMPTQYWLEAFNTSVFLINRLPTKVLSKWLPSSIQPDTDVVPTSAVSSTTTPLVFSSATQITPPTAIAPNIFTNPTHVPEPLSPHNPSFAHATDSKSLPKTSSAHGATSSSFADGIASSSKPASADPLPAPSGPTQLVLPHPMHTRSKIGIF